MVRMTLKKAQEEVRGGLGEEVHGQHVAAPGVADKPVGKVVDSLAALGEGRIAPAALAVAVVVGNKGSSQREDSQPGDNMEMAEESRRAWEICHS